MLQTKQLGGASKRELPEQAHWSQKGQEHFESNEKASHTKSRSKGGEMAALPSLGPIILIA